MGDTYPRTAVGLDARNRANEIETIPALVGELRRSGIDLRMLYLHAAEEVLLKRYAETRRKHPLVTGDETKEAIASGAQTARAVISAADLGDRYLEHGRPCAARAHPRAHRSPPRGPASLMFESFGYKHASGRCGLRVRCAPACEPYWIIALRVSRPRFSRDRISFQLRQRAPPMITDLIAFLEKRDRRIFIQANRSF